MVAHELGHSAGAGDQYAGGVDANGNRVTTTVPGANSAMRNADGSNANSQTLNEIATTPHAQGVCAAGVSAANGDC